MIRMIKGLPIPLICYRVWYSYWSQEKSNYFEKNNNHNSLSKTLLSMESLVQNALEKSNKNVNLTKNNDIKKK